MPGRRAKNRAIGPWVDLHDLPPPPRKKKKPKNRKRLHPSFKVFLALGLMPSKARQCDPLGLRVNDAMHIMEGECDKSGGLLTGEGAPELLEGPPVTGDDPLKTLVDGKLSVPDDDVPTPPEGDVDSDDKPIVEEKPPEPDVEDKPSSESVVALTNGDHADHSLEEDVEEVVKETTDSEDGYKPEDDVEKEEEEEEGDDGETKETSENVESDKGSEIVESVEAEMETEKDVLEEEKEVDEVTSKPESPVEKATSKPESVPTSRDGSLEGSRSASPACRPESPRKTAVWVKPPSPVPKPPSPSPSSKPASPLVAAKTSPVHPVKEEPVVVNDIDLRNNVSTISITTPQENFLRKRGSYKEGEGEISSGSESDTGRKRVKVERDGESVSPYPPPEPQNYMDYERDRLIQDFVSECSQRPDEMNRAAEKLHKEVETLSDLMKAKEMEWNAILRLKKLKEETLERLLRKKRQAAIVEDTAHDRFFDHTTLKNALRSNGQNQLMMVPIVSSSPTAMLNRAPPPMRMPEYNSRLQRPILPKPFPGMVDPTSVMPQGRNGPVLDVKSIIADYRSRHPQDIPRRGRRVRGDPNPRNPSVNPSSLISMSNMALGSGARVRTVNESSYLNPSAEQGRPGHSDGRGENSGAGGYKEVLAQFAKLTGQPSTLGGSQPKPPSSTAAPPPPYPEVTLHPVGGRPPSPPSSSLLHGILTKSVPSSRPSNFSPTLARLLTAPDRPAHPIPPPPYRPQQPPRVSISDIINSSKKSRNEITITPVPGNQAQKPPKEEVIMADEDDAESGDRLVIDEGADESPLQCQGCKQKSAQFVCAGCGNQWYCSRECQVTAWEDHSDVCSG